MSADENQQQIEEIDWENVQTAVDLLSRKWVLLLVRELARGSRRHNELRRALGSDITDKVLTRALRRMEASGIVARRTTNTSPPGVRYYLTPMGESLLRVLSECDRLWREYQEK